MKYLADLSLINQPFRQPDRRIAPVIVVQVVDHPIPLRRLVHLSGLLGGQCNRLLAKDVLTGLGRLDGDRMVQVRRQRYVHNINVAPVDYFPPVRLDFLPAPFFGKSL